MKFYSFRWVDTARICDRVVAQWKPPTVVSNRRSHTRSAGPIDAPPRGVNMRVRDLSSMIISDTSIVEEYRRSQAWPFLQVKESVSFGNGKSGRGVVTTCRIAKFDIVCDYHTPIILSQAQLDGMVEKDEPTEYVFQCGNLILDATSENCECHPGMRTFGRLLNFQRIGTNACNLIPKKMRLPMSTNDAIFFVANRDIEVLEELCWDYNDPECYRLFN